MITLIWAQTKKKVIGKDHQLPWKLVDEMKHFQQQTLNKSVLMGRKTWDALHVQPLPGRKNIILTHQSRNNFPHQVEVITNLDSFLEQYTNQAEELMVIGGREVFDQVIKKANKLVVSIIDQDYPGDTYAPEIDPKVWKVVETKVYPEFSVYTFLRI